MNKYAVIRVGGSIDSDNFVTIGVYSTKEEAQSEARFRRSCLTLVNPSERKYYGMKYKVVECTPRNVENFEIKL